MIRLTLLLITLLLNACVQNNNTSTKSSALVETETDRALIRQDKLGEIKRTALIIGNSDYAGGYSGTSLKNPV